MALETTNRKVTYAGNGSTTVFSVPFRYFDNSHLIVVVRNDSTEVETTQVVTTNYTISGDGFYGTAVVTMNSAPATGETLLIYRDTTMTQPYELFDNEAQTATDVEESLDRMTMIIQELEEGQSRTVIRNIITETAPTPDSNVAVTDVFLARLTGAPTGYDHPVAEAEPVSGASTNQDLTGGRTGTLKFVDNCETDKTDEYTFVMQMLDTEGNTVYRSWKAAE